MRRSPSELLAYLLPLPLLLSCQEPARPVVTCSQTFAELRAVRRGVQVEPPGEAARAPYPRERLADGQKITLEPGGLAWLRRDSGATLLVAGPGRLTLRFDALQVQEGKIFVDTPPGLPTALETPRGMLHLSDVRASVEVQKDGSTEVYVLRGAVRTTTGEQASSGERLLLGADGKASKRPEVAWEDWTGGLATTDPSAQPAPFGIGTVGARTPGATGEPRFPLTIQKLDVRVKIDHDLAITEVEEIFFNPSGETVEGIYRFRTPEGAALHRFGVDREGEVIWGRIKEKQAAAAQYQAHVYQNSQEDPALLEWVAPGVYQARLYPIQPGGSRRVVTRYAEWLSRQGKRSERRMYIYPMAAEGAESTLPRIEELNITLDLEKAGAQDIRAGMLGTRDGNKLTIRAWDVLPRADLAVELFDDGAPIATAYRAPHKLELDMIEHEKRAQAVADAQGEADYLLLPVRPGPANEPPGGLDLAIVLDASAATDSSALASARATTAALLAHLGPEDRVAVWASDAILRPVYERSGEFLPADPSRRQAILSGLARLDRGGATDLGAVLSDAASKLDPRRRGAVIYIGDGKPTIGELALAELRERFGRLPRPVRIFAVGVGHDANMGILQGLARGAFAERVTDGYEAARTALRLLEEAERPVWLGTSVDLGPGVERVFPRELGALAADETALVVGRLAGEPPKQVIVRGSGGQSTIPLVTMPIREEGDMRRRWAQGRLVQLLDEGAGRAAVVEVGTRYGIVTPFTSLYVPTTAEVQEERREARKTQFHEDANVEVTAQSSSDGKEGGTGTRAKGEEGSLGNPSAKTTNHRDGVRGPADNPVEPSIARQEAPKEASKFGIIGSLNSGAVGDPSAPTAPWSQDDSRGSEPLSAWGSRWGADISDRSQPTTITGTAALGLQTAAPAPMKVKPVSRPSGGGTELSGIGEGGRGKGDGIGLGNIGTIGHGAGLGGAHRARPPRIRMGATTVNGRLPPEVIQRIVRQNFSRFRLCYENGLQNNPNLQGRVSVHFVIGQDGVVSDVGNGGSDLPDASVVSCVVQSFSGLSFPPPEGGIVSVTYSIAFEPGDGEPTEKEPAGQHAKEGSPREEGLARIFQQTMVIGDVDHGKILCSKAASLPLDDRLVLWRERLARVGGNPLSMVAQYYSALANCEAPTWRERGLLLSTMVDALPNLSLRVDLWRRMFKDKGAADILYRAILVRIRTTAQMRELHDALGLKRMDPGLLEKALQEVKTSADRVKLLRELIEKWPDDLELALRLLDELEDGHEAGAAREYARQLRLRNDANARVRTAVGEFYLRMARRPGGSEADVAEARRTFGEIVEFFPDDPVGRRRLGDLLRAHGWYDEAFRQYETLARITPDDALLPLLLAASAQGMGKVEEAIRWTEKASAASAPDATSNSGRVARAFASAFLAWAREDAAKAGRTKELESLRERARRLTAVDVPRAGAARVILTWTHPELHPVLWSDALGAPMPAPDTDPLLGIAQVVLPRSEGRLELRLEPDDARHAARLGAEALLTVLIEEGTLQEKILRVPVAFSEAGATRRIFRLAAGAIWEER
ncbi:MAG: AgmX/PglI C-terminal domain-containing protein [Myxococcales bacterium]|nr:AgmX/PglI C-terminal domain-containing protein [Polyangiaceae bacterium]MDW8248537.1 AgmX/PglI C-terminal domain-containing protein [Myxococcales bacterium]